VATYIRTQQEDIIAKVGLGIGLQECVYSCTDPAAGPKLPHHGKETIIKKEKKLEEGHARVLVAGKQNDPFQKKLTRRCHIGLDSSLASL